MAYIYKITNDVNNKIYIGKTQFSIDKRFNEHCRDAFREHCEKRPLYSAMKKYGINHFHIELVEETNEPEEREKYWIEYFGSFKYGYNATMGGDGKQIFNHQEIVKFLLNKPYANQAAIHFGCSNDLVYLIAKENQISLKNESNEKLKLNSKKVYQYDKHLNLLNSFNSTVEASKWCYENKVCKSLNSGVRAHIGECANGKRKTAYGFIWKYEKI